MCWNFKWFSDFCGNLSVMVHLWRYIIIVIVEVGY